MGQFLAIDIGGTYMKYAVLDDGLELQEHGKKRTPVNADHAIVRELNAIVADFTGRFQLDGIGISTAGIVDRDRGEIIYAGPTIQDYRGTNFKEALAWSGVPVHVENDVNAALLGERWQGAGAGCDDIYCITLGTGIGGAHYRGGLVSGTHFQGNSVGYMLADPVSGTNYEGRASTSALNALIVERLGDGWTARDVFAFAREGDPACVAVLEAWVREVAAGLAQIILLVDPERIVIGGGVSQQGDFLLEMIHEAVLAFLPGDFLKTELVIAELFNDAALYGAVYPFFE
ncbi:Glucokinase [Lentibacillus sp. JNUCC-1]|uniref:ROK family protein n=1 Tax=Lentibacillus sp. JNUCC-1 TaxID=2654513 RepID=UPI0012E79AEF|nr:ROK family protein [Lentibacillus sp. JNUCC-1]MUV37226.1 Glucokinase [Lentibacillus sp. JNUCC-1]